MHAHTTIATRVAALSCAAVLGLTLAACGDSTSSGDNASSTQTAPNGDVFNGADIQFATDMVPHHAQAVEMVTLTLGRPLDPGVQQLADGIRDAQVPEVETMTDWLTAWGQDVPATSIDHVNGGHDMTDMTDMPSMDSSMPGMMSAAEMTALQDASDAAFQDMWLQMMVNHHTGAIEMAKTEKADGTFPDAIALATSIETSQQGEIATMRQLLGP